MSQPTAAAALRSFDPVVVGTLEADAWVAYYRRDWLRFASAGVTLSRRTLRLSWPATLRCAWLVLRANQLWAPCPGNHPGRARRAMERFYQIVKRRSGESFDPRTAAALEVRWWQVHRDAHRDGVSGDRGRAGGRCALVMAIARLYAHVYNVPVAAVIPAAEARALAMNHSDRWVREGRHMRSPRIALVRGALVRSYDALLGAVQPTSATAEVFTSRISDDRRRRQPQPRGELRIGQWA